MGRRNSHTDLFLKIQGSGKLSAEMMIMSLVAKKCVVEWTSLNLIETVSSIRNLRLYVH